MDAIRCVIVGVGGQGNLLASRLLGEAAVSAGIDVVVSEIHGMAQRGGVVESTVVLGDITSSIVSDGEADILVGFEPLETLRTLKKCSPDTTIITNTAPLPPFTVAIGQGEYPPVDMILEKLKDKVKEVMAFDGNELAEKSGNPLSLNMVMLGALIGSGKIPISADVMKKTIEQGTKKAFLESNLKAFDLGFNAVKG